MQAELGGSGDVGGRSPEQDTDIRREVLSSTDVLLVGDMFYDEHIGSEVFDLCNTFKGLKRENEVYKQIHCE